MKKKRATKTPAKNKPKIIQVTILLDEIADRIWEISNHLKGKDKGGIIKTDL